MRKLAGLVAGVALSLVAAGCTQTSAPVQTPRPSTSSSSATEPGPLTLRIAVYGNRSLVRSYRDLADAFTKNNPGVSVELEATPDATSSSDRLRNEFADGNAPDVFLAGQDQLPGLVARGRVRPLDMLLERRGVDFGDGYQRDGLEAFSAESALQCMPHDVSPLVVYYNQDLLNPRSLIEERGDPPPTARQGWTWEQFSLAARRIAKDDVKGVYFEPELEVLAPFIWSGGGEIVDDLEEPTSLTLSSGDSRAVLEEILPLLRDPDVTPTPAQVGREGAVSAFQNGDLGMILGTRALVPQLRAAPGLDFEVFPLPNLGTPRTISSITGYCVSAETEHVAAAADFVAFAVGREGASISAQSGHLVPSNVEVVHSAAFTQPDKEPANAFLFSDGIRSANETPFVEAWPDVLRQTEPLIDRMLNAPVIDLERLLAQIDARSQSLLAPLGPTLS